MIGNGVIVKRLEDDFAFVPAGRYFAGIEYDMHPYRFAGGDGNDIAVGADQRRSYQFAVMIGERFGIDFKIIQRDIRDFAFGNTGRYETQFQAFAAEQTCDVEGDAFSFVACLTEIENQRRFGRISIGKRSK